MALCLYAPYQVRTERHKDGRIRMSVPTADERPTMPVEEAGGHIGLGRTASYEAARRGDLPTIRIGRRVVVPTAALRRLLQLDEQIDQPSPAA
jgi:hypothetical protein